jgi:hypothetical protein
MSCLIVMNVIKSDVHTEIHPARGENQSQKFHQLYIMRDGFFQIRISGKSGRGRGPS